MRMIIVLLVLAASSTAVLAADGDGGPGPHAAELEGIHSDAMASDRALKDVAFLSDRIGPRLSGSPQAAAAVDYVAGQLQAMGLVVRREAVQVPHWVRGDETAELLDWPGRPTGAVGDPSALVQKLHLTALGGSVATPHAGLRAPVIVVRDFAQLASLDRSVVQGKIVLFDVPFDQRMAAQGRALWAYEQAVTYRVAGASAAARKGAVAALIRSVGGAAFRLPHTGSVVYEKGVRRIPCGALSSEDAALVSRLAADGLVQMHLVLTPRTLPPVTSHNVVADWPGDQAPEEVVIVSGHLDSWDLGTGALDDAVGVAAAMETARLFKARGVRPRRTLRVVAWMNEENGMAGARGYVERHRSELARHIAALEIDLGAGHPVGFEAHVSPEALKWLEPVRMVLGRHGAGLLNRNEQPVGSDIGKLGAAGVPTLDVIQDDRTYFDYHHTAADTLDKVDPATLRENCAAMACMAWALARSKDRMPVK